VKCIFCYNFGDNKAVYDRWTFSEDGTATPGISPYSQTITAGDTDDTT